MPSRDEDLKIKKIEAVARLAETKGANLQGFIRDFYSHVPSSDILPRPAKDLYGAALSLWQFAQQREPGRAKLRIVDAATWKGTGAVVEIVNDDMPFLVDSITAALAGQGIAVNLVIHPILGVRRGSKGKLLDLAETGADRAGAGRNESFMHVEIAEPRKRLGEIAPLLEAALVDVRAAVEDWRKMRDRLAAIADDLRREPPALPAEEIEEDAAFLTWLDDDNFTFLGYREYRFAPPKARSRKNADLTLTDGLGILRDPAYSVFDGLRDFAALPPDVQDFLRHPRLLVITKSNRRSTVHRSAYMDAIGVKTYGADGTVTGLKLFVGLFTSVAYSRYPRSIPLLRRKVARVIERAGFPPASHDGKALLHILDTYPRDELFQISEDALLEIALGVLNLQERQRIALFVRRDAFDRFVSCFVYVPRERYNTALRQRFGVILEQAYGGKIASFSTQLDDSVLARVHFLIRIQPGKAADPDASAVERDLVEAARTWADRFDEALIAAEGLEKGVELLNRYGEAFPTSYRETFPAATAVEDIEHIEAVRKGAPLALALYGGGGAGLGLKLYHPGHPIPLSDILPMLEHLGLQAITEVPHEIVSGNQTVWMQDFSLSSRGGIEIDVARDRTRFEEAFARIRADEAESDGFNRLILGAGLGWRQVVVLRLYAKVLRQAGNAFSQAYMEDTLSRYPAIAAQLVGLFETKFDPTLKDRDRALAAAEKKLEAALDRVENLDEDRIIRSFLTLIRKSLRTNYYQKGADRRAKPYLSVKLASREIELLPLPRPLVEIYVYSPRMEGCHLRGGKVARGGIRWSDRKEDFRTEILGLMKAQMVKNAVIVPVGSKGGFVVKRPPAPRDALMAEVVECYKTLMRGLLDLTDNIVGAKVVPPKNTVRHDGDDPYLVVAADKGTATFSDIANGISADYGFWLDDAFASGGSAGYDHKAMGITARGAWEAVKRHFREIGTDIQTTDFTVVGVGDMSGDVFGNGMLLSRHIELLGAFNHLHIFLDPNPDPAKAWAERKRLFDLPRSSWGDYDRGLISKGGGIFERSLKSIPLSPEMRARLGTEASQMAPPDLIQALLKAPVDLLWFGGIGTYIKASAETNADAGDRANDALRIDASAIGAKVVGEGANLAVTQRARIEYALGGGRINSDAIDNSAGVDTSDHEVNIKILLNGVVASGSMSLKQRDKLLGDMTDEVGQLVLRDNYLQTLALTLAESQGADRLDEQSRLMREMERDGRLDRAVEYLPDDKALAARAASGKSLTRPELAVLLAYVKNNLAHDLVETDLPDDPRLEADLIAYFPKALVKRQKPEIERHRLRREIIATVAANDLVNHCGITFVEEMRERSGRGPGDVVRAYTIVRGVFDLEAVWAAIDMLDNKVPAALQTELHRASERLIARAVGWFLRAGKPLDIKARIDEFHAGIAKLAEQIPALLPAEERIQLDRRIAALVEKGAPKSLALKATRLNFLISSVDIVRLSLDSGLDLIELARGFYEIGDRFSLDTMRHAARSLRADTTWRKLAIEALLEDLYGHQAKLTAQAFAEGGSKNLNKWIESRGRDLDHLAGVVQEIKAAANPDLAKLTVANRQLRAMTGS